MIQTTGGARRLRMLLHREPGIFSRQEEADLRALLDEREQIRKALQDLFDNALAKIADAAWHLDMAWPGWRDFAASISYTAEQPHPSFLIVTEDTLSEADVEQLRADFQITPRPEKPTETDQ